MLRYNVVYVKPAARRSRRDHKCSCLYHIWYKSICTTVKLSYALYFYSVRSRSRNRRTAEIQEVCKVDYVRFSCGVFYNGDTVCRCRGNHCVYGSADRHTVKKYISAAKHAFFGSCLYKIRSHNYICVKRLKSLYVLIYRSYAEIASAGISYRGVTESA